MSKILLSILLKHQTWIRLIGIERDIKFQALRRCSVEPGLKYIEWVVEQSPTLIVNVYEDFLIVIYQNTDKSHASLLGNFLISIKVGRYCFNIKLINLARRKTNIFLRRHLYTIMNFWFLEEVGSWNRTGFHAFCR